MESKQRRFYRQWAKGLWSSYSVQYKETDVLISAPLDFKAQCLQWVQELRVQLDAYIARNPQFATSLVPIDASGTSLDAVQWLANAGKAVGVGPMAGVAGLFSHYVGCRILPLAGQVMVENGGDIYLAAKADKVVGLYAGEDSPFSGRLGIKIKAEQMPLGVCTSAGTVGPSLSLGQADAVMVLSKDTVLADCAATAAANRLQTAADISDVLNWVQTIPGLNGVVAAKDDGFGVWGEVELVQINEKTRRKD